MPATPPAPEAVLLTGLYGVGKSSVAEEIAERLEAQGTPYAALDLDWLCWSNVARDPAEERAVLGGNLQLMARRYLDLGARRLVLAFAVPDAAMLDAIARAIEVPLRVVRLVAPIEVLDARLAGAPTSGRVDDLAATHRWAAEGRGEEHGEITIANIGPIGQTATMVLAYLRW